jgi:hypothetical protein
VPDQRKVNTAQNTVAGFSFLKNNRVNGALPVWSVTAHVADRERMAVAYQQMLDEGKVEVEARACVATALSSTSN